MNFDNGALQLVQLIKQQTRQLELLFEVLEQEQDALLHHKTETVESTAHQKAILLEQVAQVELTKRQLLERAGISVSQISSAEDLVRLVPAHPRIGLRSAVEKLTSTLEECKGLNLRNGTMINVGKQFTERALAILHGQSPADATGGLVYGPGGQTRADPGSQSLTKA